MTTRFISILHAELVSEFFEGIDVLRKGINDRFKKSPSFRLKRSEMEKSLNYVERFLHCGRIDRTDAHTRQYAPLQQVYSVDQACGFYTIS